MKTKSNFQKVIAPKKDDSMAVADVKRYMGALSEEFQGRVSAIAEQFQGLHDQIDGIHNKLDEHTKILDMHTEMIGMLMEDVSEIKEELKEKADKSDLKKKVNYDEFASLERKVRN